jgi:hypothetical protein
MGNSNSVLTPFSDDSSNFRKQDSIDKFFESLEKTIQRHESVLETFKQLTILKNRSIELKDSNFHVYSDIKELTEEIKKVVDSSTESLDASHVSYLCAIQAIRAERKSTDAENTYNLYFFPKFQESYTIFITRLKSISNYKNKPVMFDTDNNLSSIKKTQTLLDKYYMNILGFAFSIVYNEFVILVYTMFAITQFRMFDAYLARKTKDQEINVVIDHMEQELKNIPGDLLNPIDASTKAQDKLRKLYATNLEKNQLGGSTEDTIVLNKLTTVYQTMDKAYQTSNANLEMFFEIVYRYMDKTFEVVLTTYLSLKDNKRLISSELREKVNELINITSDLLEANKRGGPSPKSGDLQAKLSENVEITEDERNVLNAMTEDQVDALIELASLQLQMKNNIKNVLSGLESETSSSSSFSTASSPNSSSPSTPSTRGSFEPRNIFSNPQYDPNRIVPAPAPASLNIYGGKTKRSYIKKSKK